MAVYNTRRLFTKKQKKCQGRTRKSCKTAKKKCLWATGSKRSFCRKSRSRR